MSLTKDEREALALLIAKAYDKEDAALMGEANPWDEDPWGPSEAEDEWKAERAGCGMAALDAVLPLIERAHQKRSAELTARLIAVIDEGLYPDDPRWTVLRAALADEVRT